MAVPGDTNGDGVPDLPPKTSTPIGLGLLGARVDRLQPGPAALKSGMSGYLLPFELVSVHLLVVLVGAAYLARTKRLPHGRSRRQKPESCNFSRNLSACRTSWSWERCCSFAASSAWR